VREQQGREDSVLSFYRKLIALRKDPAYKDTFVYGDFVPAADCGHNVIAYLRESGEQTILVAGNFNAQELELKLPRGADGSVFKGGKILLDNGKELYAADGRLHLAGFAAAAVLLEA
jgi:oligo-1,6-glucosidase